MEHDKTHEVQTILSLEWIRDHLDLHELPLNAANSRDLDLIAELVAYGADLTILKEADRELMDECLADALIGRVYTGSLQRS